MTTDYKNLVLDLKRKGLIVGDETIGYEVNPYLEMPKSLSFSDIAIMQGENVCSSRLDANIRSEVARGLYLEAPLLAANMSSVVSPEFCVKLYKHGALGVMHRAWPKGQEDNYIKQVKMISSQCSLTAASVGAGPSQVELAIRLVREGGANIIVIDIAQGYSQNVIDTGRQIKRVFGKDLWLIVGNTINTELMYKVDDFADAVKVGIGSGAGCSTKNTAGATLKQWTAVSNFRKVSKVLGLPIVSDGGISEPADVVKAIAAGSNSCMMGQVFARCPESAAEEVEVGGEYKKVYFGMASTEAQKRWRGGLKPGTCPEGKTLLLDLGEPVERLIERYTGALKSGITYVGATDIKSLQELVEFVRN